MQLRRVILYQNGIGYFERTGHLAGKTLELRFGKPELNDVLKTLTVIDRLGASVATVDVPTTRDRDRTITLGVRLGAGRAHDLLVGYAVPTATWKAAYRVVLDPETTLLQGWAMVNNSSAIEAELGTLRERVAELAQRAFETRANLAALDKVRGIDDLRKRLVATLAKLMVESETLGQRLGVKMELMVTARTRLADEIRELTL